MDMRWLLVVILFYFFLQLKTVTIAPRMWTRVNTVRPVATERSKPRVTVLEAGPVQPAKVMIIKTRSYSASTSKFTCAFASSSNTDVWHGRYRDRNHCNCLLLPWILYFSKCKRRCWSKVCMGLKSFIAGLLESAYLLLWGGLNIFGLWHFYADESKMTRLFISDVMRQHVDYIHDVIFCLFMSLNFICIPISLRKMHMGQPLY